MERLDHVVGLLALSQGSRNAYTQLTGLVAASREQVTVLRDNKGVIRAAADLFHQFYFIVDLDLDFFWIVRVNWPVG